MERKLSSWSQSSRRQSFNDLEDNLLVEILQRLPTSKDVFRCSAVCKHWYVLIYKPYFISRFISYHVDCSATNVFREYQSDSAVMVLYFGADTCEPDFQPAVFPANPDSTSRVCELGEMMCGKLRGWGKILTSYNDLMFCLDPNLKQFYIANPFRKEWIFIPQQPKKFLEWNGYNAYTLVCEPYCSMDGGRGYSLNNGFRYRILGYRPTMRLREHQFVIYCSEAKVWTEVVFKGEEYGMGRGDVVAYEGKLYWYTGTGKDIMVLDPFNDFAHLYSIKNPRFVADDLNFYLCRIGFCGGVLRMMRVEPDLAARTCSLQVWDLKDHEASEWSSEQCNTEVKMDNVDLQGLVGIRVLTCHPFSKDIVYLGMSNKVILCDMRRREVVDIAKTGRGISSFHDFPQVASQLMLPWWPTPLFARCKGR